MQLRFATGLTSTEYVTQEAWRDATLERCPLHPHGGCSFTRHGTYGRVEPPGTRIPRWYCPESHCTFSLLADCFAARLSGTLTEVEAVVRLVEQASSREAAAEGLRLDIELPGVLRWLRRRVQPIHLALHPLGRPCSASGPALGSTWCCSHCGTYPPCTCRFCRHPSDSAPRHHGALTHKAPSNTEWGRTHPPAPP